jgi:hypothetical protein
MADNQAGIMALPENQDMQKLSIYDSYDATNEALAAARPDVAQDLDTAMAPMQGIADDFTDEQLDLIIELVQYLYENKEEYAKNIAELAADSGMEGIFPPEYDPEFLTTFGSILLRERKSRGADQPPFPEKFARGGIAEAARIVANQGRYGDTMLAHITPEEARMLRRQGGSGSINPVTGLPEYWNPIKAIKSAFKGLAKGATDLYKATVGKVLSGVAKTTKEILASPIGRIAATIALTMYLGPVGTSWGLSAGQAASLGAAISSGTVTAASGGSAKDVFKAAAFAAIAAPEGVVGSYTSATTQAIAGQNEFARAALNFGADAAIGIGVSRLSGESLEDSVKQGLTSAAISTGVGIAQKGIPSWKSASEEVTNLADANKSAEAMSIPSSNQKVVLEDGYVPSSAISSGSPVGPRMEGGNFVSGLGSAVDAGMANVPVSGPATAPDYSAYYKNLPDSTVSGGGPASVTKGRFDSGARASVDDYINSNVPTVPLARGVNPTTSVAIDPTAGGTAPAPGGVPGIGASIKKIGGGIADFAQGNFKQGFNDVVQGGEDLFFPSGPSPEQVAAIEARLPTPKAQQVAIDKITPGPFRTYGPGVAAGLGIAGLSGAFDAPEPPPSEQRTLLSGTPGEDLITKNPDQYVVQNMPNVNYGESGEILAPSPQAPRVASIEDIRVAPSGDALTMQDISRPTANYAASPMGPQGQSPFVDPYQYWYQQLLASQGQQPRYYAMGGITSLPTAVQQPAPPGAVAPLGITMLSGGGNSNYPRRTGQISGPGTEKSDSIPAMLSDGEFVMTASAVRGLGKGSRREGAKRMYALMHQLEKNAARG